MKIAVLGDVHGNRTAFEAVIDHVDRWEPDAVVSTGDIVNRGPSSADCLAMVEDRRRSAGWRTLRGNHEDYVIFQAGPEAARTGPQTDSFYQSYWTYRQLEENIDALAAWEPLAELAGPDGGLVRVAHGSVLGVSRGIFADNTDDELIRKVGAPEPSVFCAGHTHSAFVRQAGPVLVVNAGSVGIPFDGDWRAAYAQLVWLEGRWQAGVVRLEYDRAGTLTEYRRSGFLTEAGPIAWLVLAEYLFSRSQLYQWHREYYDEVVGGRVGLESAVREQLARQGLWSAVAAYL